MSRMLDALKAIEERQRQSRAPIAARPLAPLAARPAPSLPVHSLPAPSLMVPTAELESIWETDLEPLPELDVDVPLQIAEDLLSEALGPTHVPLEPTAIERSYESCVLPTTRELSGPYLEMGGRIAEQLTVNYCNVLLFVTLDRQVQPAFSITHLAQSYALCSGGDVLLVDGDLRDGHLTKTASRGGPGLIEAMLGQAHWPDIIHPTNVPRIDFVTRGNAIAPTVERPEFGWQALRPLYRGVLIGPAPANEPDTNWLAARCDAVYFIVSRPHTRRGTAIGAVNALRACGANVVGCIVVND